jgi:hypothetical protein
MGAEWLVFGLIYFVTIAKLLGREKEKPIIIGVPDVERGAMYWLSKPKKTWVDKLMEWLPKAIIAFILGGVMTFFTMSG